MSYLKMALAVMKAATVEGEGGEQRREIGGQAAKHTPVVEKSTATALERILTCADCPRFEANHGPNPRQGWGFCRKREKGRFACATACEASISNA